jgi:hypothetical protein
VTTKQAPRDQRVPLAADSGRELRVADEDAELDVVVLAATGEVGGGDETSASSTMTHLACMVDEASAVSARAS